MFKFDVTQWAPRFILEDTNGYALAKAIEAGAQAMNDIIEQGMKCLNDFDSMPEWRLDEMAWEYDIPYDATADADTKRAWIRNAYALSRLYGTPEGVRRYLAGYFDGVAVEEFWKYSRNFFHFRVLLDGTWTHRDVAWATKIVNQTKNVRSVLDGYVFRAKWRPELRAGCALYGEGNGSYRISKQNVDTLDCYADENGYMLLDENDMPLIVED